MSANAATRAFIQFHWINALGGGHEEDGINLSEDQFKNLAANFANPEAIYWQKKNRCAVYVFPDPEPGWRVVMFLNMPSKEKGAIKSLGRFDGLVTVFRREVRKFGDMGLERIK